MKTVAKTVLVTSMAALGLSLAACDSAAENNMEDQATAVDEAAEAQAEQLDDAGMEEQAEAVAEQGEETKDAMEDQADEMDAGAPQ